MCVCVCVLVTQSCLTLCHPMDCSRPGSSVYRILQDRILEWVATRFSRGSSWPRVQTWVCAREHTHTHLLLLKYLFTFGLIMSVGSLKEVVQCSVKFLFPSVALRGVIAPEVCHRHIDTMTEISSTLELWNFLISDCYWLWWSILDSTTDL